MENGWIVPIMQHYDCRGLEVKMSGRVRPPAVAGMFYPGDRAKLATAVDGYLDQARVQELDKVRAVIAPHAGYIYSGPTAGYSFKALQSGLASTETPIYLLGPAHRVWFDGVSTGDFASMETPLGAALVDQARLRSLWALESHYQALPSAHQGEHCLEVQIPFLQRITETFRLVPMLFGQVDARAVGRELAQRLHGEPESRLVVSTDLSHFNDYETARRVDQAYLQAILEGDDRKIASQREGACGQAPIMALMQIAAELSWTPHLLDYRNSGDTAGDKWRVVGYASIAYTART